LFPEFPATLFCTPASDWRRKKGKEQMEGEEGKEEEREKKEKGP